MLPGEQVTQKTSEQQYKPSELTTFGAIAVEVHAEHLVALSASIQSLHAGSEFWQQSVWSALGNPDEHCKHLLLSSHLTQFESTTDKSQQNNLSELNLYPLLQVLHLSAWLQSAQFATAQHRLLATFIVPTEQLEHKSRDARSQSLQFGRVELQQ